MLAGLAWVLFGTLLFGRWRFGWRGRRAAQWTLGGFVLLVTPEPSVVRAAVMAAVVLLALASGRPAQGLPVLAVAVFGSAFGFAAASSAA